MGPDTSVLAKQASPSSMNVSQHSELQPSACKSQCSSMDGSSKTTPASAHNLAARLCCSRPSICSMMDLQPPQGEPNHSDSSGHAATGSPYSSCASTPGCQLFKAKLCIGALRGASKSCSTLNSRKQHPHHRQSLDLKGAQCDFCDDPCGEVMVTITTPTNATSKSSLPLSPADSDKLSNAAGPQPQGDESPPGSLRSRRGAIISRSMLQLTGGKEAADGGSYSDEHEVFLRSIDDPKNQQQRASSRVWSLLAGNITDASDANTAATGQQQGTSYAGHLQHPSEVHGGSTLPCQQHQTQQDKAAAAGTGDAQALTSLLPAPKWAAQRESRQPLIQQQAPAPEAPGGSSSSNSPTAEQCSTAAAAVVPLKPRPPVGNGSPLKARPALQLRHSHSALLPPPNTPTAAGAAAAKAAAARTVQMLPPAAAPVQAAAAEGGMRASPAVLTQEQLEERQRVYEKKAAAAAQSSDVAACLCMPIAIARHCPEDLQADIWQPRNFIQTRKLYEGKIAVVVEGYHKASGRPLALKVYNRARLDVMERFQLAREVCLHMRCCHPYIAALYAAYKDNKNVYLLIELAQHGNLYQMLMAMQVAKGQVRCLSERDAVLRVIRPLMSALSYLHEQGVIHRDIKLENILMMQDGTIKLADFGLSIDTQHELANTRLGTQGYFAPEVLTLPLKASPFEGKSPEEAASRPSYTCQADVWSAGVVCYEVLTGRAPFAADNTAAVLQAILERKVVYPSHLSNEAVSFLSAALTRDPAARATSRQLLHHEFIRNYHLNITL